jgi:hypothetical protein
MTNAELPTVAAVVAAFRRAPGPSGEPPAGLDEALFGALVGLHANNLAQWKLEDAARHPLATDAEVAMAKRGIDGLNLTRHHFVEQVDGLIDEAITQSAGAPPATESPGMAFDRLSVLIIRLDHTEAAGRSPTADVGVYAARLPALREQVASLEAALAQLLDDLRNGERSFLPYRQLKLYGPPTETATPSSQR